MQQNDYLYFEGVKESPRPRIVRPLQSPRRKIEFHDGGGAEFFHKLFLQADLSLSGYRLEALERRLPSCLRFLKAADLAEAQAKIEARPELVKKVLDVILLGVTDFGRDRAVFDHLRKHILPVLRAQNRPLKVWSAACSDGRELYSIAILMKESGFENVSFLGTDCRAKAIQTATEGEYPKEILQKLDPEWKNRLVAGSSKFHVRSEFKTNMQWRQADLLKGAEAGPWDMILWRNMAIYLKPEVTADIWTSIIAELASGGYVVSGRADHPPRHSDLERIGPGIYQKKTL